MEKEHKEKEGLTRRQFLTYALGGTGAFMGAVIAGPLVTFTVDPLTKGSGGSFVKTGKKVSDFNADLPTLVEVKVSQKDGWTKHDVNLRAWVIKKEDAPGGLLAFSPKCTHLGCQVNGTLDANGKPTASTDGEWWFHCPCHGSKFDKYGYQSPGSPATRPLDVYDVKVEGGEVLLSTTLKTRPNKG
jgi:menaquinol-cytochrome c reductase iron-sulfur subunit